MRVNLIFTTDHPLPQDPATPTEKAMLADLNLRPMATLLAQDDELLERILLLEWLHPLTNQSALAYRQATVADALADPRWAEQLYTLSSNTLQKIRNDNWSFPDGSATYQLYSQSNALDTYLTGIAAITKVPFTGKSAAGKAFSGQLKRLFTSTNLAAMHAAAAACRQNNGYSYPAALSGDLGSEPAELDFHPAGNRLTKIGHQLFNAHHHNTFEVPERDDNASSAISHDENIAAKSSATILTNVTSEFATFFEQLRYQSGLLVAIHHYRVLLGTQHTTNLIFEPTTTIQGLKNTQLLLTPALDHAVVANDLHATEHQLMLISGANQGGKTTFLRALGQAQVLGQSGFPLAADRFACPAYHAVLTHFRREEDTNTRHGKLDEELARMQVIVANLKQPSLLLMNESFSSTNEHEGSIINEQIIRGLLHQNHTIVAVSHQYELGQRLATLEPRPLFLRAERLKSGERTFKLVPGLPRLTSYGLDIFNRVFSADDAAEQSHQAGTAPQAQQA